MFPLVKYYIIVKSFYKNPVCLETLVCLVSLLGEFGWANWEVPLPHSPLLFFGSRPIFRTGKTPKIPFLCLSLLPNPTETLAMQAKALAMPKLIQKPVLPFRSVAYRDSRSTRLKLSGSLFTLFSFCICL